MAKLEGKLPFTNGIYSFRENGKKVKVTRKDVALNGTAVIYLIDEQNRIWSTVSSLFYEQFKRCKEGTAFRIEEGWNE